MPVINPNNNNNDAQRSTFRPPWVKNGPSPLPMPSAPWAGRSNAAAPETKQPEKMPPKPILKKQTKITIPVEAHGDHSRNSSENGQFGTDQPRTTEKVIPITRVVESSAADHNRNINKPPINQRHQTPSENSQSVSWRRERPTSPNQIPAAAVTNQSSVINNDKMSTSTSQSPIPKPPPPPMMPPMPPPPPPPPMTGSAQPEPLVRKPISKEKAQKLEALKSRPRRRPDWSDMMKEVEDGKKLKHVQCNDRSAPVIPSMKAKGQFVYESENKKDAPHNKLLKQIQTGVRLRKIKCNDRSKPNLDGLRKFRRQMTTEDLIQKSVSMADVVAAAVQPDELDDIDKVRDDLQSAKQMLALELRSKEAMERENKRLMARLANLEAELEKEKNLRTAQQSSVKGQQQTVRTDEDEKLILKLKEQAAEADRTAKDIEQKYHTTAEELDNTRRKLESAWLLNQQLEMQRKQLAAQGTPLPQIMKQPSMKRLVPSVANGGSIDLVSDDEDEETETESEEESDKENSAGATQERQIVKELRLLTTKLRTYREKQAAAIKERRILREQLAKRQKELKQEKKKYKLLQKEVDKMAKLMRETDDDDYEDEHAETEEEEEETETESESEESEEEQSDTELPLNATAEDKKKNYQERVKRHENRLSSLKKGNYLMKANIERLQDDMNKQREMSLTLQEDLNNILADLG